MKPWIVELAIAALLIITLVTKLDTSAIDDLETDLSIRSDCSVMFHSLPPTYDTKP